MSRSYVMYLFLDCFETFSGACLERVCPWWFLNVNSYPSLSVLSLTLFSWSYPFLVYLQCFVSLVFFRSVVLAKCDVWIGHIRILGIGLELACNGGLREGISLKIAKISFALDISLSSKLVPVLYRENEYDLRPLTAELWDYLEPVRNAGFNTGPHGSTQMREIRFPNSLSMTGFRKVATIATELFEGHFPFWKRFPFRKITWKKKDLRRYLVFPDGTFHMFFYCILLFFVLQYATFFTIVKKKCETCLLCL